ncbi:hypothetical protein D6D06_04522, partial [Aureobasidium pullulans]
HHDGILILALEADNKIRPGSSNKRSQRTTASFLVIGHTRGDIGKVVMLRLSDLMKPMASVGLDIFTTEGLWEAADFEWCSGLQIKWQPHTAKSGRISARWGRNKVIEGRKTLSKNILTEIVKAGPQNHMIWADKIKRLLADRSVWNVEAGRALKEPPSRENCVTKTTKTTSKVSKRKHTSTSTFTSAPRTKFTLKADVDHPWLKTKHNFFMVDKYGNLNSTQSQEANNMLAALRYTPAKVTSTQMETFAATMAVAYPQNPLDVNILAFYQRAKSAGDLVLLASFLPFQQRWEQVSND